MELEKSILFKFNDYTCEFRNLNESHVSQDYIIGLKAQKKYIENIPIDSSFSSQKNYINDILYSKGDVICGLFLNNELVGTAGIQSSTTFLKHIKIPAEYIATIGIFLFKNNFFIV